MSTELREQNRKLMEEIVSLRHQVGANVVHVEELNNIRRLLGVSDDLLVHAAELLNYARSCRDSFRSLETMIQHLRGLSDPEARAIGNSLDATFRSVQPPRILAR